MIFGLRKILDCLPLCAETADSALRMQSRGSFSLAGAVTIVKYSVKTMVRMRLRAPALDTRYP